MTLEIGLLTAPRKMCLNWSIYEQVIKVVYHVFRGTEFPGDDFEIDVILINIILICLGGDHRRGLVVLFLYGSTMLPCGHR